MTVSVSSGVDGEDDGLGVGGLGAVEDALGGGVVGVEVYLLEGDLAVLLEGGDLLDRQAGVQRGLRMPGG